MKLLTNLNMTTIDSATPRDSAPGFPGSNLMQYDPGLIWKPITFDASGTWILFDLLAASTIDYIWLNNANFTSAYIQANDTDVFENPAVNESVTLAADDNGVYKGFFDFTTTNYRYVRIVIPDQTLTGGDTIPYLGNVILGSVEEIKVKSFEPNSKHEFNSFISDGGTFSKFEKAKPRHVFTLRLSGTKAEIDSAPIVGWDQAILFADLGSVEDSWLVYPPAGKNKVIRNPVDCEASFTLEERV